jgi:hypothetical protein
MYTSKLTDGCGKSRLDKTGRDVWEEDTLDLVRTVGTFREVFVSQCIIM